MSRKFCVLCGKAQDELREGLCEECFVRERVDIVRKGKSKGYVCRNCLAVYKKGWQEFSGTPGEAVEEAALGVVERDVRVEGLTGPELYLGAERVEQSSPRDYQVRVRLTARGEGVEKEGEVTVPVKLSLCLNCQRRASKYFEAIIQLRGMEDWSPEEREGVRRSLVEELDSRGGPRGFISHLEEVKEGFDLYVGSSRGAKKSVLALKEHYGGTFKESPSLYGTDSEGREVYRPTYLLRLPQVRAGDILEQKGELYQVTATAGNSVSLYDLNREKSLGRSFEALEDSRIVARKGDQVRAIVTEVRDGEYQLLELETYKTFYIRSTIAHKLGAEVNVVSIAGSYYLLKGE